jgi:ketosteroid isomerase-like protein
MVNFTITITFSARISVNTSNIPNFRLEEIEIEEAGTLAYQGNEVSVKGGTEEDVASRNRKVIVVFVQLYAVWRNHNI